MGKKTSDNLKTTNQYPPWEKLAFVDDPKMRNFVITMPENKTLIVKVSKTVDPRIEFMFGFQS
jgi:hypothetical protein